ncbi:hypothetical protein NDU88_004407 [Pleurodeles waltl]|uniref:Uncharacterized protein n=1 Tax=Pleurodeles waltl TaxID=8319 RepID=A0AAV7MTD0_PLEWA|nr:hypothetical protein NDU88_004407 [Pleurodeles waltl]
MASAYHYEPKGELSPSFIAMDRGVPKSSANTTVGDSSYDDDDNLNVPDGNFFFNNDMHLDDDQTSNYKIVSDTVNDIADAIVDDNADDIKRHPDF